MNKEELGKLYPINISKYNKNWTNLFIQEKVVLTEILGNDVAKRIEHIGSTAVPGLDSKPTIDILIEIPVSMEIQSSVIDIMTKNDYIHMKEQKKHLMFVKGYTPTGLDEESYHVHMASKEHESMWNRLYFRDYLRLYPDIAKEYENLKYDLSNKYKHDREAYTEGKADFVKEVTLKAVNELK